MMDMICSMSHWYDQLIFIFVPSLGLGGVVWHMETLKNFIVRALSDTLQSGTSKIFLDVLTATQGGMNYLNMVCGFLLGFSIPFY